MGVSNTNSNQLIRVNIRVISEETPEFRKLLKIVPQSELVFSETAVGLAYVYLPTLIVEVK